MKLLLIRSQEESSWGSCKVISPNLHSLYLNLGADFEIEWFDVPQEFVKGELESKELSIVRLNKKILKFRPEKIVFLDHLPVPAVILALFSIQQNILNFPPLVFHIYGDFTYFSRQWMLLNNELKTHPIEFIVASKAQKLLVEEFLEVKQGVSQLCFPVSLSDYYFDLNERNQFRSEHNLTEKDFVIIYTGRVSLQKNVEILIKEFINIKATTPNLKLWVVGAFDDVGADFIGYDTFHGYMFAKIEKLLLTCSSDVLKDIKFWGHQNKLNLRKLKNASDAFVSLSLYHDEDFGMSPAEALATGLPAILTDWGGYSSFASDEWKCKLLGVNISEYGLEIDVGPLAPTINELIKNKENLNRERTERAKAFMGKFSIENNIEPLKLILLKPNVSFSGFNWLLEQYSNAMSINWSKSKLNKFLNPDSHSFYQQIYKNYTSLAKNWKSNAEQ